MRRLTFMYCDVVGSTELSRVHSLEAYHDLMEGYRRACVDVIERRFEGHIVHYKGDGVLSAFGYPVAHENDAERAVRAGLALVRAVGEVRSAETGEPLAIRVGVHNGTVYRKLDEDEILGFATNIGARYETLAAPGTVVVSDEVRQLVEAHFELEAGEPEHVKGTPEPLQPFRVVKERTCARRAPGWRPLIGRDDELRALRAALASGATGVLVWGEPGVGKSRLVAALTDELDTVRLHGSPFHADAGLHPVRGLLEARCGLRPDATGARAARRPRRRGRGRGTRRRRGSAAGAGAGPRARRRLRARRGRGTAPRGAGQPHRPGLPEGLRAGLGRRGRALVRRRDARPARAHRARRRVRGGHLAPLRARELGGDRAAAARGRGSPRADRRARARACPPARARRSRPAATASRSTSRSWCARARWPPADRPSPGSVPAALYEPLVARLYATPDALGVAATAAAAGQVVDRSLLAATTELADEQLDATLGTLVATRILEPVDDARFRFRHELLREVAYELQPPSWRRMIHGRLGDALLAEESGDWHVVAAHLEQAERFDEAADAYLNTAEWARRRGALGEARAHLTRAIELVQDTPPRGPAAPAPRNAGDVGRRRGQPRRLGRPRPLPRAGRLGPGRRRAVQHADRAVGVLPVVRRARPRPRDLGHPA